jgi:hypothetical protein
MEVFYLSLEVIGFFNWWAAGYGNQAFHHWYCKGFSRFLLDMGIVSGN